MESDDVIELGSSDEEAVEPAAKKIKPLPNAMVHIPHKLHGITITPALPNKNKGLGKYLMGTKVLNSSNRTSITMAHKNKTNGRHSQTFMTRPISRKHMNERPNFIGDKLKINPINVINHSPVVRHRIQAARTKLEKAQLKVQAAKHPTLPNLPSSITIKRTKSACSGLPKILPHGVGNVRVNKNITMDLTNTIGNVLTVELDDEGSQSSTATASPQWYLRPEEELKKNSLEIQNNQEPSPSTMIEITIEDSPVKPCLAKERLKIKDTNYITIEDSPIKPLSELTSVCDDKDEQDKHKITSSKKKLNYPVNSECCPEEIHRGENDSENKGQVHRVEEDLSHKNECNNLVQPNCMTIKPTTDMLRKDDYKHQDDQQIQETTKETQDNNIKTTNESTGDFHPIYQRFIDLCFELENSDDMRKIVDKKIKTYYKQVSKEFVESEEFLEMVSIKLLLMKASPLKMYLYIKDIVDELNLQRKMAKSHHEVNYDTITKEKVTEDFEEDKYDRKRRRQIRKLEKTIKKLHRAIQKLEEQEVDFDDEEDSVYLLTERYKERLVRVHAKFCQLTNTKMPSEPHIQIQCRPGQPPGPAKRLEKWINKKVPLGTPLPFPDFHDVLKCVRQANEEDRLGWNEADIMEEARDLFTRCGRKLQRRRQENEWRLATSRITQERDPAEENESLKKKLDENKTVAATKETELVNKYADKQNQLKLEGVEIGDKEADESPVESEEEEVNDNGNSLGDKQKRKDRLRRLLEEKSRKSGEGGKIAESLYPNKDGSDDGHIIRDEEKCMKNDTTKIESTINSEDMKKTLTSTIENVMEDEKTQNSNNRDNITLEVTCDVDKVDKNSQGCKNPNAPTVIKLATEVDNNEHINLVSDDSDVEELSLLQKLHSGDEVSSPDSSDCDDSLIAISDTLDSNSECENNEMYDVISIENSSYSESEIAKDDISNSVKDKNITKTDYHAMTNLHVESHYVDSQESAVEEISEDQENCEKAVEVSENILLASSEEDDSMNKDISLSKLCGDYINLKDDDITISETEVQEVTSKNHIMDENDVCEMSQTVSNLEKSNFNIHMQEEIPIVSNKPKNCKETIVHVPEAMECIESLKNENTDEHKSTLDHKDVQAAQASVMATGAIVWNERVENDDSLLKVLEASGSHCGNKSDLCESDPPSVKSHEPIDPDLKFKSVEMILEAMFNSAEN